MMTVRLIAHTPEPEKVVAAAAKLCYSDAHITDLLDGLDEEKTARFLTMLSDVGHASPIEHASFTFGIEGVSRTLLAQITRHRIASFSVQSQRYVRLDDFRYVIPPEIEAIPEAKAAFLESMDEDAKRYLDLVKKLEEGHTARLMAEGLPEKHEKECNNGRFGVTIEYGIAMRKASNRWIMDIVHEAVNNMRDRKAKKLLRSGRAHV